MIEGAKAATVLLGVLPGAVPAGLIAYGMQVQPEAGCDPTYYIVAALVAWLLPPPPAPPTVRREKDKGGDDGG